MTRYEWKKLLWERKGLLWIALYLAVRLVILLCFTDPYRTSMEENREYYEYYLAIVEGELTEENKIFLTEYNDYLSEATSDLTQLRSSFYKGEITDEEYEESREALRAVVDSADGFDVLFNQFIYVRANSEERYFLYTNGWNGLLVGEKTDYLLLLLLVVLIVPVFCEEYRSQMDMLLVTTQKGASRLPWSKLAVSVSVAGGIMLAVLLEELLVYGLRFGLPDGSYTLQSLSYYGGTQKPLSLWAAFLLEGGLRIFGHVYAAVLLALLSSCIRKYAPSLVAGTLALLLPYLSVRSWLVLGRIPAPWGFITGTAYLTGSIYTTSAITQETIQTFQEISAMELALLVAVSLAVMGGMGYIVWHRNANWWGK